MSRCLTCVLSFREELRRAPVSGPSRCSLSSVLLASLPCLAKVLREEQRMEAQPSLERRQEEGTVRNPEPPAETHPSPKVLRLSPLPPASHS